MMDKSSEDGSTSYSKAILSKYDSRKRKNKDDSTVDWRKQKKEGRENKRKWAEGKEMAKIQKKLTEEQNVREKENEVVDERQQFGRDWTVSIALPGSIMDNAQSDELRTYLAGQISRAAGVFCVDEVVVYDELKSTSRTETGEIVNVSTKRRNGAVQLAKVLEYLECPQYLRKAFFPQQPDLKFAGLLNPLDATHHYKADDWSVYREGVVSSKPVRDGKGSYVDVGLKKYCQIDKTLLPGVRVTVRLDPQSKERRNYLGKAVAPSEPRTQLGRYWGYKTRLVTCLSEVISQCPYKEGYDVTVGTSERGKGIDSYKLPHKFKHLLIVFGGLKGLEFAVESDDTLDVSDPVDMFTSYLNTCPNQGSNTIRTEEAILISLSAIRPKIVESQSK